MFHILFQKMDRRRKIPLRVGQPRCGHHERRRTTSTRTNRTRTTYRLHQNKSPSRRPPKQLADRWADEGRQSENIRWSLPTNRPIFSWTENGTIHRSPMNPTVQKRIDLQVALKQLKAQTRSSANFLIREDNSRDLLGKFHKDKSVWIRARRRVLQCISYQFPCALQLKMLGILKQVKCRLCENIIRKKNGPPRLSRKCGTHTMLLTSPTTPTYRHPPRNMEGTDVLDTEILYRTKRYI